MEPGNKGLVTAMSMKVTAEVTVYKNSMLRGTLRSVYLEEPYEFTSFVKMIDKMEEIFDSKKFPQAFMKPRTFSETKPGAPKRKAEGNGTMKDSNKPNLKDEAVQSQCTFEINVRFRQNATWQGQILWAEKNQKQNFRSVLEMLKLMDEALTESAGEPDQIEWTGDK